MSDLCEKRQKNKFLHYLPVDCKTKEEYEEFNKQIKSEIGFSRIDKKEFVYISVKQFKKGMQEYITYIENKKIYENVEDHLSFFISSLISRLTKNKNLSREMYYKIINELKYYY